MICECGEFIRENDYLCPVCHRDTLKELEELRMKCERYEKALEDIADSGNESYMYKKAREALKDN